MKKTIITRADDLASSHAANKAIARVASCGFIKNVSVMAVGPYLTEAAELLADHKNICFGLHATINSEWDQMRWGSVSPRKSVGTLLAKDGCFYQNPEIFIEKRPSVNEIISECSRQLDQLTKARFSIAYVDFHMFPERYVPGLQEEMSKWIFGKGLIDHSFYCNILPGMDQLASVPGLFEKVLAGLKDDQYLYVIHPAVYSDEIRKCVSDKAFGEKIAYMRDLDMKFACDANTLEICHKYGYEPIRYDKAIPSEKAMCSRDVVASIKSLEKKIGPLIAELNYKNTL
jgi:cytochrome c551/c552